VIQTLYDDAIATREWLLRAPRGFREWLVELQRTEVKQLTTADEPRYVYRSQGRLDIINRLINMPDELEQKGRSLKQ